MTAEALAQVDATLLLLVEARECAERGARELAAGAPHVRDALARVDRELLAMHRRLMDETIFRAPAADSQLALGAA